MGSEIKLQDIRAFTIERFCEVKTAKDLVHFHSINKYLLMSFSQVMLNKLGNIVANHGKIKMRDVLMHYDDALRQTLECTPTRKTHANALRRMSGHFKKSLPRYAREIIEYRISEYQKGKITIQDVLINIRALTDDIDNVYVARQTYFLLYSKK